MEEKNIDSGHNVEDSFSNMGNYMVNKLKSRINSIKERLEEVDKSDKKNKTEITEKLRELIKVMTIIAEKTELQTKTQRELLELMGAIEKLDNEIDDLLFKDGS